MYIKAFIATIVTFLVVDVAWISLVVVDYYESVLGEVMRETPAGAAAAGFYLAYAAGIVYFASRPAIEAGSVGPAVLNGAVLGALAYGTYTVTNYAILEAWTVGLVVSDIAWGSFLTAVCSVAGYLAGRSART